MVRRALIAYCRFQTDPRALTYSWVEWRPHAITPSVSAAKLTLTSRRPSLPARAAELGRRRNYPGAGDVRRPGCRCQPFENRAVCHVWLRPLRPALPRRQSPHHPPLAAATADDLADRGLDVRASRCRRRGGGVAPADRHRRLENLLKRQKPADLPQGDCRAPGLPLFFQTPAPPCSCSILPPPLLKRLFHPPGRFLRWFSPTAVSP